MAVRAFRAGSNPRVVGGDPDGWLQIALLSGLSYDDLVKNADAIWVLHFVYKNLLGRAPDATVIGPTLAAMRAGKSWEAVWRDIALSPEREQRFGFFSPAPFSTPYEAQSAFGLGFLPTPEQCFGALGDKCEGGIPELVNNQVQPRWLDTFTLPDGTEMGYVEVGIAVGSILHDNSCFRNHSGLNCNGIGAGDLIKAGGPADNEWNKAAWNVMDHRTWRDRFGPYPTDKDARRSRWYDDLRPVPSREAWMAPSLGMITIPVTTIRYNGGETRQSQQLRAPTGTWLDERDGAFCRSGSLVKQFTLLKSAAGTCR
ncbi:MAG: hypothetical protein M3Z54_03240 [Gemmatimonadota bacterium]|nr:hypothetical protein [Gemmatimonadota bacterium]